MRPAQRLAVKQRLSSGVRKRTAWLAGRQHARLQTLLLLSRGGGGGRRGRLRVLQCRIRGLQLRTQLLRPLSQCAHPDGQLVGRGNACFSILWCEHMGPGLERGINGL